MGGLFSKPKVADTRPMANATEKGIALQEKQYNDSKWLMQPWYKTGTEAKDRLAEATGIGVDTGRKQFGELTKSFNPDSLSSDPGYKFRLAEGEKSINRAMASRGKYTSPEATKALNQYGQNLASGEFTNAYNRYNLDRTNLFNRLAGLAGYGQTAYTGLANAGQNYANQVTGLNTGLANAQVASQQARNSNRNSMFNTLVGGAAKLGGAYILSDSRLKTNIKKVGEKDGVNIYKFNYKGKDGLYEGVMAQEVEKVYPNAVHRDSDGYLSVDYSKLPVDFKEIK